MKIYCDGSCLGNPGLGGWSALYIQNDKLVKKICGSERYSTNNKMELRAAIEALKNLTTNENKAELYTDSNYLKLGITEWIKNWKITNWNNGRIKNIEYWQELEALNLRLSIKWFWIKAHNKDKYNEIADKLARHAAINQINLSNG